MKGNDNLETTNLIYHCSSLLSNCGSLGAEATDFFFSICTEIKSHRCIKLNAEVDKVESCEYLKFAIGEWFITYLSVMGCYGYYIFMSFFVTMYEMSALWGRSYLRKYGSDVDDILHWEIYAWSYETMYNSVYCLLCLKLKLSFTDVLKIGSSNKNW
jgi:hypothetical protein